MKIETALFLIFLVLVYIASILTGIRMAMG
jgi:hypothetical protein